MSKLVIRSRGLGKSFELNCLQFSSPIVAAISSTQTRQMMRHFPVKVNQSEIDFLVQFSSEPEFEEFQDFVRKTQKQALSNPQNPGVTLFWPERNINNWTGMIKAFRAGGMRRNYSPRATFSVSLIDSSVAKRSMISSIAADWRTLYGLGSPSGFMAPAGPAENALDRTLFGTTDQEAADGLVRPPMPIDNINNGGLGLPQGVLSIGANG